VTNRDEAISVKVFGRVQGVGFRYSTQNKARDLKIVGYVRNEADGSVSVYGEGPADKLSIFSGWLKKGPLGAYVNRVEIHKVKPEGCRVFEILF